MTILNRNSVSDLFHFHKRLDSFTFISHASVSQLVDDGLAITQAYMKEYPDSKSEIPCLLSRMALVTDKYDHHSRAFNALLKLDSTFNQYGTYLIDTAMSLRLSEDADLSRFKQVEQRLCEINDIQNTVKWGAIYGGKADLAALHRHIDDVASIETSDLLAVNAPTNQMAIGL